MSDSSDISYRSDSSYRSDISDISENRDNRNSRERSDRSEISEKVSLLIVVAWCEAYIKQDWVARKTFHK